MTNNSFQQLAIKLFEARQTAHNAHLSTKSFAKHKALQEFYEGLLELTDEFIEVFQGEFGIMSLDMKLNISSSVDIVVYLRRFAGSLKLSNETCSDRFSYYKNIIDEILGLTFRTIYKLENLA